ncbi:hypothetical protein [Bacillus thuringiensis]|uniref:hypothetical protein n=1 Tax=Bacillus thuringiensis TaxID=1428 RepID=UPI0016430A60|nr:hypothetical protein [Bacillus thuringiensis]
MCVLEVHYQIGKVEYQKSFLLAWPEEGFQLRKTIQHVLTSEHQQEVRVLSTDLEEI